MESSGVGAATVKRARSTIVKEIDKKGAMSGGQKDDREKKWKGWARRGALEFKLER